MHVLDAEQSRESRAKDWPGNEKTSSLRSALFMRLGKCLNNNIHFQEAKIYKSGEIAS